MAASDGVQRIAPLPPGNELPPQAPAAAEFWLDGNAILCACPDCSAPLSVRTWLLLADCWRCGACLELTEEQQRQVELLLAASAAVTNPAESQPQPPADELATPSSPGLPRPPVAELQQLPTPYSPTPSPAALRWLSDVPAWLVSAIVHLIVFILMGLLTMQPDAEPAPMITLSAVLSRQRTAGAETMHVAALDAEFDLPLPSKADLKNERHRDLLLAAARDARELRLDDDTPHLPDLQIVKSRLGQPAGQELALAARDPRLRVDLVTQEGGTTLTEAAVARGLRWLANHQNGDGSWSLSSFHSAGNCNCGGRGTVRTRSPGTALALLPFLGAGQTHLVGKYQGVVSRGLKWLIDHQRDDGDLRHDATGNEGMYAHGQAAIVLCEAFAMTGDEALRRPAQRAIEFIAGAQYHDGGWRYRPGPKTERGDMSVVGWQVMALQSARAARLPVPQQTWEMAEVFLDSVQHKDGAQYGYQPRSNPSPAMTAEALLCRVYLGWKKDYPPLVQGVDWLGDRHLPRSSAANIYYWYYATQVMHHFGGTRWDEWNTRMRDILVATQETRGHAAGSWRPAGEFSGEGGRIYMTALAVCTLEVYYRHLPIFRQIELGQ